MKRYVINEYEKVVSEDLNDIQKTIHQSLYDKILYPFLQSQDGFLGDSFTPTRGSSSTVILTAGRGFMWDATQTGAEPKYRAIQLDSDLTLTIGAGTWAALPVGNPRIDIIVVRPLESTTETGSRYIKTAGTGPIVLQTVDKVKEQLYEVNVVEGTPAGSPVAPSTPVGWMKVANVTVAPAGIATSSDVVDTRTILLPAIQSFQTETRMVAPSGIGTDTTLAAAIANMPAAGGSILLLEDISIGAVHTIPANTILKGMSRGIIVTMLAGARIDLGDSCDVRDLTFTTAETALTFLKTTGKYCNIERSNFVAPTAGLNTFVLLNSDANSVEKCVFSKTVFPATNTGIEFGASTANNTEEKNIYTS